MEFSTTPRILKEESSLNVICPKENNVDYTKRNGAYAIIKMGEDSIAIAKENDEYFFLGGGIEEGESEKEALKREIIEETGYTLKNVQYFDTVKSYEYSEKRGNLEITATIYTAEFNEKIAESIEKNEVIVCNPKDYKDKLKHEYQKYILKKYINEMQNEV